MGNGPLATVTKHDPAALTRQHGPEVQLYRLQKGTLLCVTEGTGARFLKIKIGVDGSAHCKAKRIVTIHLKRRGKGTALLFCVFHSAFYGDTLEL